MLKIGEFSKLSHITVKALRFYEKEGLLMPENIDEWTGYRSYETCQLETAAIINHILKGEEMKYQVTIKEIPSSIVYYTEVKISKFSDMMTLIPELEAECMELNPGMKRANPPYEFCEYLDEEHKEEDFTKVLMMKSEKHMHIL